MTDTIRSHLEQIRKIEQKKAFVAVIGLGYVGLPLALENAKVGFTVVGLDRDENKIEKLHRGESYIHGLDSNQISELQAAGTMLFSTDMAYIKQSDIVVICVPTPLTVNREPDLSYIQQAIEQVAKHLRAGQLIALESTTYPGTTEEVVLPQLKSTGLAVGEDFFLSFSPERVDPGNTQFTTKNTTKVVGGITSQCLEVAAAFYAQTVEQVVKVSSPSVAEMAKIFENTYRAVNIALVNEVKFLCHRMGLDVWEVLEAAATKPFGIQVFYPGPGIGGHCIPVDPYYLAWKAREYDYSLRFVDLAGQINVEAMHHVLRVLVSLLNRSKKTLNGSTLFLLGVAYKRDVDDYRESPALKMISYLQKEGARIIYHDPFIPQLTLGEGVESLDSVELTESNLASADCTIIITDHTMIDYQFVVQYSQRVLDTRNATKGVKQGRDKIKKV